MEQFLKKYGVLLVVAALILVATFGPLILTIAVYSVMIGACILAGYGATKVFGSVFSGAIGLAISGMFLVVTNYFGWYNWAFSFAWMIGSFAQNLAGALIFIAIIALAIFGGRQLFSQIKN